jgi:MSHA pilin protein MshA
VSEYRQGGFILRIAIRVNGEVEMKNAQSGFTLIELVIVIVILGILAAFVVPKFQSMSDEAKEALANQAVGAARAAAVITFAKNNGSKPTPGEIIAQVNTDDMDFTVSWVSADCANFSASVDSVAASKSGISSEYCTG